MRNRRGGRHRRRPAGWRVGAFIGLEIILLACIPALAWTGFRLVLDTTTGTAVDPELDPDEPGYEAFLQPTPVGLAIGVDDDDALSWVVVLALGGPGEQGGSVLLLPPATVLAGSSGEDPTPGGAVPSTLVDAWARGREQSLQQAVGDLLAAGIDDVTVVDPDRLALLVSPVTPLEVSVVDDLPGFEQGDLRLDGDEVAELLLLRDPGESDAARLARQEEVWRSWLRALGDAGPEAVPGETVSGIGRFLSGLALGRVAVDSAPVSAEVVDGPAGGRRRGEDEEVFAVDSEELHNLVEERIPFPVSPRPGVRPLVRVLDGSGTSGLAFRVARDVVRAGGQVTVLGNADRFDLDRSRVVFFDGRFAGDAAELAEALGIDAVQQLEGPSPDDLVDLTVVVGSDLAPAYR